MTSKAEICNLALSHLASGKEITDLDTERSQEAAACRRFYDIALDITLKSFPWPFATRFISLGLVEEDPNEEWDFSYRYPSDCLFLRRLLSGLRVDTRETRVPYKQGNDDTGTLIYTDLEEAEAEYTVRITNSLLYPPDFVMAFSYQMAAFIAPRVTAGDPFKLGEKAFQLFQLAIANAKGNAANEQQPDVEPDNEFMRARL